MSQRLYSTSLALSLIASSASASPQFSASPGVGFAGVGTGGSDDCASAEVIAGSGIFGFDTTAASTGSAGQSESLCSFFAATAVDNDVWFSWTADFTGTARFSTCASTALDTKIAVYPGGACPADGSAIACNDDACSLQSELNFAVTSGSSYLLQVGNFPGASGGTGQFFIGDPPAQPCAEPHDGASETSLGLSFGGDTLAMVYVDCLSSIDTLEVAYGSPLAAGGIPVGSPVVLGIWDDPTNDADPGDALLLHEIPIPAGVTVPDLDQFVSYDLVSLVGGSVSLSGGSFVGVVVSHGGNQWPFALDQTSSEQGRNWIGGATISSSTPFDFANLLANDVPPQSLESINFPGHWLLNATGTEGTVEPGTAFCFCDGTSAPCFNTGVPGNGCGNGTDATGANLSGSGVADVLNDSLLLTASGLVPFQPGLYFQGTTEVSGGSGQVFGDGLRCAGGSVLRLEVAFSDAGGMSSTAGALASSGGISPGDLRTYQLWYRDPVGSPCGAQFNLTNGYSVQW